MNEKVSIVIATYKRSEFLFDTVTALSKQSYANFEIIVVVQKNKALTLNNRLVKMVHLDKANLPSARNAGVKHASGEIVLFLDDDIEPHADLILNHVRSFTGNVGGVVGRVLDPRWYTQQKKIIEFNETTGEYKVNFNWNQRQEVISVVGTNMSFKKEIFKSISFDPFYIRNAHFEEVDFAFRMRNLGYKIIYDPNAQIKHLVADSGGCRSDVGKFFYYCQTRNATLFYLKHCKKRFFLSYLKRQRGTIEFQSRHPKGGHAVDLIVSALIGIWAGLMVYLLEAIVVRKHM